MKNKIVFSLACLLSVAMFSCQNTQDEAGTSANQHTNSHNYQGQREPNIFYVTDFGAKADTSFLSTAAIQKALDAAAEAGGGKVVVTPGVYKIGTIIIKSNTTLEVMAGATLLGSPNLADYIEMEWGHNKDRQPYHLVTARDAENIEISGGGIIDGNGPAYLARLRPCQRPPMGKSQRP